MSGTEPAAAAHAAAAAVPEFTCAEVWGGNRATDSRVDLPGIRGRIVSQPCRGGRGGDIHYISICGSGLISRMCLADVAGHGETVAATSGEIHHLLRRYMNNPDQRKVLSELNQWLESREQGTMTTAAAATYFHPARSLSISYAGHPPAWYYTAATRAWQPLLLGSATSRKLGPVDIPLAVQHDARFTRRKQRVARGDRVLMVTDGVLEAPDAQGRLLGTERLEALLDARRGDDVDALVDAILAAVRAHTGTDGFMHDDVTLLLLEFVPGPGGYGLWFGLKNRLLGPRRRAAAE